MAKSEFVLSIGDDNVVLTRIVDGKVANAWLASPDPAMANEELGEALAEDKKCKLSVLVDTLDQTLRDEEIPKVGILDRRKVLGRHVNMAFPGANLRGARLIETTASGTLMYQFAAIPLEARVLGWADYVDSLPNDRGGFYALSAENVDMLEALGPKVEPPAEGEDAAAKPANQWRHLIGINATGGLRQIIEKNGRLCLSRLTQAPPPDTPPADFADMIIRDFRATITYIRRLGYSVGEPLDVIILTQAENKAPLDALNWEGARSVTILTPYEAAATLGLGSIGREDQAFCDVLHAAWFAHKRKPLLPLTRAATIGDTKDDIRELAFLVAPYAAALMVVGVVGWTGWTAYETYAFSTENTQLQAQLDQVKRSLTTEQAAIATLPYDAARMRNVLDVSKGMDAGRVDIAPILKTIGSALQSDAVVMSLTFSGGAGGPGPQRGPAGAHSVTVRMRMADVIIKAEEAVQVSRKLLQRLTDGFGKGYKVELVAEPSAAQSGLAFTGNLLGGPEPEKAALAPGALKERFYTEFRISKAGP
jgi:hypothetical protein